MAEWCMIKLYFFRIYKGVGNRLVKEVWFKNLNFYFFKVRKKQSAVGGRDCSTLFPMGVSFLNLKNFF